MYMDIYIMYRTIPFNAKPSSFFTAIIFNLTKPKEAERGGGSKEKTIFSS